MWRATKDSLDVGTRVPYAMPHQMGYRKRGGGGLAARATRRLFGGGASTRVPARPPIRVDALFMAAMGRGLQRHVQDVLNAKRAAQHRAALDLVQGIRLEEWPSLYSGVGWVG